MTLDHYTFVRCHRIKEPQTIDYYRFRNDFNEDYIVEVFYYKYNVYAIKFYLKNHSSSSKRYQYTFQQKIKNKHQLKTGNHNFFKVMNTILMISMELKKEDEYASFGFMGAPRNAEINPKFNKKNINADNTVADTKRYKVYYLFAKRYFNPLDFEYIDSKSSSILLLRNNKNKDVLTKDIAEHYIVKEIIPGLT